MPALVVGVVLALAAGGMVFRYAEQQSLATEVRLAAERSRYLQEVTEELDGHPDRPWSHLVADAGSQHGCPSRRSAGSQATVPIGNSLAVLVARQV